MNISILMQVAQKFRKYMNLHERYLDEKSHLCAYFASNLTIKDNN